MKWYNWLGILILLCFASAGVMELYEIGLLMKIGKIVCMLALFFLGVVFTIDAIVKIKK